MKKIYTALLLTVFTFTWAQDEIVNPFEKTESQYYAFEQAEADPGDGGLGGDDPMAAPIEDVVPFLLITALALAAYTARKRRMQAS